MKRENTQLIKAIIEEFIKEERLEEGLGRARLFKAWDLVVGEVGAKATTNKYFKEGVLYCTISSSIIRTQMYYRKEDIMAHMNKMLNGTIVTKIILK